VGPVVGRAGEQHWAPARRVFLRSGASRSVHVPGRDIALAPTTELNAWASAIEINTEVGAWLQKRISEINRGGAAARVIANTISGLKLPKELAVSYPHAHIT
jgi:hypothetical protein